MSSKQLTYVTRPTLPPLDELLPLLERIWSSRWLTNMGPMHQEFEAALASYFGAPHITLVGNASIGLVIALRHAVSQGDEVITTPFSFVATSNAIAWAGATPVFVDIDQHTLNIDPAKIEQAISSRTKAILAVHCYGQPCDTDRIGAIARRYNLRVIYDAAHAFGAKHQGRSLASFGDMSVLSFHATKVFNTFEGGAIVVNDRPTKDALDLLSNHGIVDEETVSQIGINGKLNEFAAAVGLLQLKHLGTAIAQRRERIETYHRLLADVSWLRCVIEPRMLADSNCYAFPIIMQPNAPISRDQLHSRLLEHGVVARKYFHPLISRMDGFRHLSSADPVNLPIATSMAARVLCLPLFPDLEARTQEVIANAIASAAS
jgi:dTDP-4-amino-4,6-dideoxygalactose transaminase